MQGQGLLFSAYTLITTFQRVNDLPHKHLLGALGPKKGRAPTSMTDIRKGLEDSSNQSTLQQYPHHQRKGHLVLSPASAHNPPGKPAPRIPIYPHRDSRLTHAGHPCQVLVKIKLALHLLMWPGNQGSSHLRQTKNKNKKDGHTELTPEE